MKKTKKMTTKERITQLEKLADCLERMRLGDYVTNLNKTSRILWLGLLSGIARGVGLTIGATLVIAIIFKIISALISMNVPYISDMMKDVKQTLESRYMTSQPMVQQKSEHKLQMKQPNPET